MGIVWGMGVGVAKGWRKPMGPGKAQQATNLWDSEAAGLGLWKFVTCSEAQQKALRQLGLVPAEKAEVYGQTVQPPRDYDSDDCQGALFLRHPPSVWPKESSDAQNDFAASASLGRWASCTTEDMTKVTKGVKRALGVAQRGCSASLIRP